MDIEQVTLAQMRYALAVEEAGSFRVAAERSFVSPSGLSMQIQKLEDLLGVLLFDRSKRPLLVTEVGSRLLEHMAKIVRETARLEQMVLAEDEWGGIYRLGIIPTLAPGLLPLFLHGFMQAYPAVQLHVEELKTDEIIARLHEDSLDAGILAIPLEVPGIHEFSLGVEAMWAYLPKGDPLLQRPTLSHHDLMERELWLLPEGHCFRTQVLSYCRSGAVAKPGGVQFESGTFETLIQLVDAGMGATILPELITQQLSGGQRREQLRPLVSPIPLREIGLVTARLQFRNKVREALTTHVAQELRRVLNMRLDGEQEVLSPFEVG